MKKSLLKCYRKNLELEAQHVLIDNNKTRSVPRRQSDDTACIRRPSHISQVTTISTTNSARTLYNTNEKFPNSPTKAGKCGCEPASNRTLSIGSSAYEPLERRPCSISPIQSSCSSSCDVHFCASKAIESRPAPSYEILGNTNQALSEMEPPFSEQWPSQAKTQQPLVLPQERETHKVSSDLRDAFTGSMNTVQPPISLEKWLRLAIWWLVKSRIISHLMTQNEVKRRGTDASQHQNRWHATVSAEQAHADLLKSSWILEEVVLAQAADEEFSYVSVRKMIKDLSASLHTDLQESRNGDRTAESWIRDGLSKYDLHLLESFEQTIEAEETIPAAIDDPVSALRWFEIDQDNAGLQHEKVLFRTFVNAQLGSRHNRSKSRGAPYMLLAWTAAGNCDIFVSLCNHRGSVNLSRKLAVEDLEKYKAGDDPTLFSVKFPTQEAEIKFLSPEDAIGFFTQPLIFFATLEGIKPRPGELAIYQASISTYNDSSPRAVSGNERAEKLVSTDTSSCGLRVYECVPDKCWKSIRRLVISTPPDSIKPKCISHWLPADQIKIVAGETKVTIKWSDCGQLIKKELGNFDFQYSYIYKANEPNQRIDLEFGSASEARKFEKSLLFPTEIPPQVSVKTEFSSDFQDIKIYRLFDVDEPDRQYHSIALSKQNPKGPHMTEIYYAYRDLDWIFSTRNGTPSIVDFPALQISHYVSTIPRLKYKPNASDPIPDFSEVVAEFKEARFELGCDHDLNRFMYGLTGWTNKFLRPVSKLHLVETGSIFKNRKEQYRGVFVQLWGKAAEEGQPRMQLAVRLGEKATDRWITASLLEVRCRSELSTMSYSVEFPALLLKRGVEVDTKYMTAVTRGGVKADVVNEKRWKTTLIFSSTERE